MSDAPMSPDRRFDAVICDVDGCLSPEDAGSFDLPALAEVAEHNRLARDLQDRPVVTVCTGRPVPFAEAMSRAIGNTLPIMAENGAWLWDPRDNTHELDPAITAEHLTAVAELDRWTRADLGPLGVTIQPGKSVSVTHYHPDTGYLAGEILEKVRAKVAAESWPFRVSMTWFYINCDLEHVSKTTAIERFKRRTGIATDRLAGIGDTMADTKIADAVGWFACPANAQDGLKDLADFVATEPMAAGVVEILGAISGSSSQIGAD